MRWRRSSGQCIGRGRDLWCDVVGGRVARGVPVQVVGVVKHEFLDLRGFAASHRLELVPTPTDASYLNRIEARFRPMSGVQLADNGSGANASLRLRAQGRADRL
jgi:hypothetical protein